MWRFTDFSDAEMRAFKEADPFPYLVLDNFLDEDALPRLLEIADGEPLQAYAAEIYAFEASPTTPATEEFQSLLRSFETAMLPALSRLAGITLRRADMRAYAYGPGHYLLPHTDHQDGLERRIAYAFYLPSPEPPMGGELELFACSMNGTEATHTTPHTRIAPVANRCVVFEVSHSSLHQVREVIGGSRISLAGWFYP